MMDFNSTLTALVLLLFVVLGIGMAIEPDSEHSALNCREKRVTFYTVEMEPAVKASDEAAYWRASCEHTEKDVLVSMITKTFKEI